MNRNVTAAILIVLAIGIYATYTKGVLDESKAIQVVNDQYVSAIQNAETLIKTRDQVLKTYNNLNPEDRDRLDKIIPSTVDNIRLIIDLNSVAVRHGFSLDNIKAAASNNTAGQTPAKPGSAQPAANLSPSRLSPSATPTLDTVDVSFNVTAPYLQFISFMQDLEANLRIMDITHLSMTSSDTGVYSFSVSLRTYWIRQ